MSIQELVLTYNGIARIAAAITLITFCIATCLYPSALASRQNKRRQTLTFIFLFLTACTLFIWRAPFILYPAELNPDESQTLASARILSDDPVPWRSVDTTTSGPLNSYVYMWTYAFGENPTYLNKRATSVLLCLVTVICLELCAYKILGLNRSFLAILPLVLFFAFSSGIDFVHASTEYLPGCMLAIATALMLCAAKDGVNLTSSILIGVVLGLIPFAKLQASLLALSLGIFAIIVIGKQKGWSSRHVPILIAAALLPALFFTTVTIVGGSFDDMIMRSFAQALLYKGDQWELSYFQRFQRLMRCSEEMMLVAGASVSLFIAAISITIKCKKATNTVRLLIVLCWFLVGVYSVVKSGFIFPHYLTLLVTPVSILLFVTLKELDDSSSITGIGLFTFLPFLLASQECLRPDEHRNLVEFILKKPILQDELSQYISQELKPGDRLGIWGWTPKYFIEANARSATKDLVSYFLLIDRPYTLAYRESYTRDMIASRPKIFIDTATDLADDVNFPPQDKRRYTCYAPLAAFINENYDKVGEYTPRGFKVPVLIFKLKN